MEGVEGAEIVGIERKGKKKAILSQVPPQHNQMDCLSVQKICGTHEKGRVRRNTPQMTCFGKMILTQRMLSLTQHPNHGQHKMRVMNN